MIQKKSVIGVICLILISSSINLGYDFGFVSGNIAVYEIICGYVRPPPQYDLEAGPPMLERCDVWLAEALVVLSSPPISYYYDQYVRITDPEYEWVTLGQTTYYAIVGWSDIEIISSCSECGETPRGNGEGFEIKFRGTAIEYFSLYGGWEWKVRVEEFDMGPFALIGMIVNVYNAPVPYPSGYIDPNIEPGDRVEVYGLYQGEDNVALFGSEDYYIKRISTPSDDPCTRIFCESEKCEGCDYYEYVECKDGKCIFELVERNSPKCGCEPDPCEKDSDNDGVNDCDDDCPNTYGTKSNGCPEEDCDNGIDDDKDGKTDCNDPDCSSDPNCDPCKKDSDNDGVNDCDDDCPNTYGTKSNGCPEEETGSLEVIVKDKSGNYIQGATVYLDDKIIGYTDSSGRVYKENVPAGKYTVKASKSGKEKEIKTEVEKDAKTVVPIILDIEEKPPPQPPSEISYEFFENAASTRIEEILVIIDMLEPYKSENIWNCTTIVRSISVLKEEVLIGLLKLMLSVFFPQFPSDFDSYDELYAIEDEAIKNATTIAEEYVKNAADISEVLSFYDGVFEIFIWNARTSDTIENKLLKIETQSSHCDYLVMHNPGVDSLIENLHLYRGAVFFEFLAWQKASNAKSNSEKEKYVDEALSWLKRENEILNLYHDGYRSISDGISGGMGGPGFNWAAGDPDDETSDHVYEILKDFYFSHNNYVQLFKGGIPNEDVIKALNEISMGSYGNISDYTSASLGSPANLHTYDSQGNHVGVNPDGTINLEIPNAFYSGPDIHPQMIIILDIKQNYKFVVEGKERGEITLTVERKSGDKKVSKEFNTSISRNSKAEVEVSRTSIEDMKLDKDGDGNYEKIIKPSGGYQTSFLSSGLFRTIIIIIIILLLVTLYIQRSNEYYGFSLSLEGSIKNLKKDVINGKISRSEYLKRKEKILKIAVIKGKLTKEEYYKLKR